MINADANPQDRLAIIREEDREDLWFLNDFVQPVLTSQMTGGRFQMSISRSSPSGMPPLHVHENEDEIFFILEGKMTFWAGTATATLGPGDCILMPKGVPHTFQADPELGAKRLVLTSPGEFDSFQKAVAEPADYKAPKKGWKMDDATQKRLQEACDRYGITLLGPPGTRPSDL